MEGGGEENECICKRVGEGKGIEEEMSWEGRLDVYDIGTTNGFGRHWGGVIFCFRLNSWESAAKLCTNFLRKALYSKKMVYSTSVRYQELRSAQLQAMLCAKDR